MNRLLTVFVAAVIAFSVASMLIPQPAEAARGVKFFVVEWRLTWDSDETQRNEDGTDTTPLQLKLKGKASLGGQDFDKEFEMVLKDAEPYLEILRTCAMGRLNGVVSDYDTEGRTLVGMKLSEFSCRAILK